MSEKNKGSLSGKKIVITAGPTWVALDKVRVISNTASAETGILIARALQNKGARTTLIMGPCSPAENIPKEIRVIRFRFFDELKEILNKEIQRASALIHSAAVSDYRQKGNINKKVRSERSRWKITLVPTEKLIDKVKSKNPGIILFGFKFIPDARKETLIKEAKKLINRCGAEAIIANTNGAGGYSAYIVEAKSRTFARLPSKKAVAASLTKELCSRMA